MTHHPRFWRLVGAAAVTALLASGCGNSDTSGEGDDGPVTIRFAWWGNDTRAQETMQVIEAFEAKNPDIKVSADFSDFGGYWDKMATQTAGGDAPDLFAMSGSYPSEYASRGALLDLSEVSGIIDTSDFAEGTVELGQIDGTQYTVTAGVNAMSMVVDPVVFEAAGVDLPDDETWTWEDYSDIAAEVSAKTPPGTYGTTPMTNDSFLAVWARQHGEELYAKDGSSVAMSEDTLVDWFEMNVELMENGGAPEASVAVEDINSGSPEQTLMGVGRQGMKISWSNQMNAYSGNGLMMMKLPGEAEEPGTWLRSSMEYAISSGSSHPEEAARLLNFLVNDEEAAKVIKLDRGMQANLEVRAQVLPLLDEGKQQEAEYLDRLAAMDITPPAPLPPGSSDTLKILDRQLFEVLFGRVSAQEAAKAFIAEVNTNLSGN
ncbi:ABC transporter substrate-binding protein [Arthrobacter citreus]|uniref:ABC transporter substrate-binding protein n=1 Tax=Arthrobacter TaxID=1663 RepID=UPI001265AA33|nr:sugar ABC transporter substrate-binding protein [Arthrobacter gandavensis]